MSPGATFERVYNELKRMLAEGELPPGSPIEPALIGKQIVSSITPIRDALHRLTGERLVEAPNHNGFRVPVLTEATLRDLYGWAEQLLIHAVREVARIRRETVDLALPQYDVASASAHFFLELALASGSGELARAVQQVNDRLSSCRKAEIAVFEDASEEFRSLLNLYALTDYSGLRKRLMQYHRRRARSVAAILYKVSSKS